jgi:hypothetical protein
MPRLPLSLEAWGSDAFAATIKAEVAALEPLDLCLHRLATTGHPMDTRVSVTLIESRDAGTSLEIRLGVFFEEILPGCSCGFEPEPQPAYGELMLHIDRATAGAHFEPAERATP